MLAHNTLKKVLCVWLLCLRSSAFCKDQDAFPEANNECPEGKSLFSEKDIQSLILKYVENDKNATGAVDKVLTKFMAYKLRMIDDLTSFFNHIQQEPEHLKVMLKSIVSNGRTVEPLLQKIAFMLQDVPTYMKEFNEKTNNFAKLVHKFHKFQKVCDAFCPDPRTTPASPPIADYLSRIEPVEYHCSSLEDLQDEIKSKVTNFTEAYAEELEKIYQNLAENFNVDVIKKQLVDEAIESFAKAMFSVLYIKQQYEQLNAFEKEFNLDSAIRDLKENSLNFEKKLLELETAVEKYGKKCNACNPNLLVQRIMEMSRIENEIPETGDIPDPKFSLLDKVFNDFAYGYKHSVDFNITDEIMAMQIALGNKVKELKQRHKEIKSEIAAAVADENLVLENIKKIVPVEDVKEFDKVKNGYASFLTKIQGVIDSIKILNN